MTRVLVVDDEPQLVRALRINLRARRYDVDTAPDGTTALHVAARQHPDLVVLDLGLPDMDGTDVIRGLRGWTRIPIIVLSGRSDSRDKVGALDAGADDYITKPFGVDELLARIRAVTRRGGPAGEAEATFTIGGHTVDLSARTITGDVRLTPTEWRLLDHLLRHPGQLLPQRTLLNDVWGPQFRHESNYLRQYMARLRRKLETDPARPRHLLTEPGMGYRFRP
ncbi:DNA-binding response regulator [Paractinoplanes abujensis]|uniref:Two-component system KDP operon response regulator KdpE n=1 Tax=Paractinoplanes abujensis TaxID=882441 RepID=A0A7W7CQV6_9ACTN|nr:response regulator [Actinoplanes abujensis]MBB4693061.1 two-component system KDP operon response regulator KdpE [Actinoplanes abujensis]GID24849.1 DNA-binding response regulator [Actinoplanes abujensis]